MKYYFFPTTEKECKDPVKLGYGYALANKDRWIETDDLIEVNTYDRGTTHITYQGIAYIIHKDYVDISNHIRIYVGKPTMFGADQKY